MNANSSEAVALLSEGRLTGSSSDEEPGAKTMFFSHNEIPNQLVSTRSSEFIRRYYPLTTIDSWNDWKWQLRNSYNTIEALQKIMNLNEAETEAILNLKGRLPLRITPYFASLLYDKDPGHPLRRNVIPVIDELIHHSFFNSVINTGRITDY